MCSFISNEARITKVSARVDLGLQGKTGVVCADDLTPRPWLGACPSLHLTFPSPRDVPGWEATASLQLLRSWSPCVDVWEWGLRFLKGNQADSWGGW